LRSKVQYYLPRPYRLQLRHRQWEFLNEYSLLLRGIGARLPPTWLSRKIRVRLASLIGILRHRFFGFRVKFPKYVQGSSVDDWMHGFNSNNPHWIRAYNDLKEHLAELFRNSYAELSSQELDDLGVARERRNLRFAANRLVILGIGAVSVDIFRVLTEQPWLLATRPILQALVQDGFVDEVLELAMKWHAREFPKPATSTTCVSAPLMSSSFLCSVACRALGFAAPNDNIVQFLWKILENSNSTTIERISASESILRLRAARPENAEGLLTLIQASIGEPFFVKNLVLLYANAGSENWAETLRSLVHAGQHWIIADAVQYGLNSQADILLQFEPEIIQKYYARHYPDVPLELVIDDYQSVEF